MDNISIRPASLSDISKLRKIGRRTFEETFSGSNTPENMVRYLDESFSAEKLASELSDPDAAFYFAVSGEEVIGYLKLNFGASQTELNDNRSVEIERIYVLKEFHGQKVGQMLYEKAIHVAREACADYIWLGVWEENPRAIAFYEKNGFKPFDKHIFKLGDDEQTDLMMKLELKEV